MSDYPEHEKMAAMRTELDAVASFLEALESGELKWGGRRLHLGTFASPSSMRLDPVPEDIPSLLAQWSGIDQGKIEAEKREMLERCQEMAAAPQ